MLVLAVAAACGGGKSDSEQVKQVVRDFAKAASTSDGKRLCRDLLTRQYLEQTTGATGKNAVDQCVQQISALKDRPAIEVLRLARPKVAGDRATVVAELRTQGVTRRQLFRLKREDGKFKLSAGG